MEVPISQLPPGDPRVVDEIVANLKSKGIFDTFRKDCLADVDTKPAYQNLVQRVDAQVKNFLATKTWKSDLSKNQLREGVRKNVQEAGILDVGIDAIINQVVNPKISQVIGPCVENEVFAFLKIKRPPRNTNDNMEYQTMMSNLRDDTRTTNTKSMDGNDFFQMSKMSASLPVEADAISSEEDETLLQCPTEKVIPMEEDNAVDGFEAASKSENVPEMLLKEPPKPSVENDVSNSMVTNSQSSSFTSPKETNATLFKHHSLDSISSNSSGLSFSSQPNDTRDSSKPKLETIDDGDSRKTTLVTSTSSPKQTKTNVGCSEENSVSNDYESVSINSPLIQSTTSSPFSNVSQTSMTGSTEAISSSCPTEDSQDSKKQPDVKTVRPESPTFSNVQDAKPDSTVHSRDRSSSHKHKSRRSSEQSKSKDDHYSHKSNKKSHRKDKDDDSDRDKYGSKSSSHSSSHKSSRTSSSGDNRYKSSSHKSSHKSRDHRSHKSSRHDSSRSSKEHRSKSSGSTHEKAKSPINGIHKSLNETPNKKPKISSNPKEPTKNGPSEPKLIPIEIDIGQTGNLNRKPSTEKKPPLKKREQNNNYKKMDTTKEIRSFDDSDDSSKKQQQKQPIPHANGSKLKQRILLCSFASLEDPFTEQADSASESDFEGFPDTTNINGHDFDELFSLSGSNDDALFEGFPDSSLPLDKPSYKRKLSYLNDYMSIHLDVKKSLKEGRL